MEKMQENNDLYPAPFYFPLILDTDGAFNYYAWVDQFLKATCCELVIRLAADQNGIIDPGKDART